MRRVHFTGKIELAHALAQLGDDRDAPAIAEVARIAGYAESQSLIRDALAVGGPSFARTLIASANPLDAQQAIQTLTATDDVTAEELETYLQSPVDRVRLAALAGIVARSSRSELEALLRRYTESATSTTTYLPPWTGTYMHRRAWPRGQSEWVAVGSSRC